MGRIFLLIIVCLGLIMGTLWLYRAGKLSGLHGRSETIILCVGDSITSESYPQRLEMMFLEDGRANVRVLNFGKNGYSSGEYLTFIQQDSAWKRLFPEWVLVQLGTNDVRVDGSQTTTAVFIENMESIVRVFTREAYLRHREIHVALATIPPVCEGQPFDRTSVARVSEEINPAIIDIGKRLNLPVIDNYRLFVNNAEELPGIHPTRKGYEMISRNWYQYLKPRISTNAR